MTLGWYHPGYIRGQTGIATSTEHRRRLYEVHDVAVHIIGATMLAATTAAKVGRPIIEPDGDSDRRGWRRIYADPAVETTHGGIAVVRAAIGEASLTHEAYMQVHDRNGDGNDAVRALLTVAEEADFLNPELLVVAACPVVMQGVADTLGHAPEKRFPISTYATTNEQVYGLLPDVDEAIRAAAEYAAIGVHVADQSWML